MKMIELWDLESNWLGLIIPWNTGVIYSNQVGGTACSHPEVEGFLVPLYPSWLGSEAQKVIGDFYIPAATQDQIEDLVGKFLAADEGLLGTLFRIPPAKAPVLAEAWVPVVIREDTGLPPLLRQLAGVFGYLTWSNSD